MILGRDILKLRKAEAITKHQLAEASGVSCASLSTTERGSHEVIPHPIVRGCAVSLVQGNLLGRTPHRPGNDPLENGRRQRGSEWLL